MKTHIWKRLDRNPEAHWGVSRKLWTHGDVYQLVRKGLVLDAPLDCYASHARSRASTLLQFGNHTVVCAASDADAQRNANAKEILQNMARNRITHATLVAAQPENSIPLQQKDALFRSLKRFVEFYFR
jgi:hypothetical protein